MYVDLLKYFAVAFLVQIALLILCGSVAFALVQYESYGALQLVMMPLFVYAWPLALFGSAGGAGLILSTPVLVVLYSVIFSVLKIRLRDRNRGT